MDRTHIIKARRHLKAQSGTFTQKRRQEERAREEKTIMPQGKKEKKKKKKNQLSVECS